MQSFLDPSITRGLSVPLQGVGLVAAETIMRRLLPELPALRFQHLMRVICHEILHHIQDDHPTRQDHRGPKPLV